MGVKYLIVSKMPGGRKKLPDRKGSITAGQGRHLFSPCLSAYLPFSGPALVAVKPPVYRVCRNFTLDN